MNPLGLYVQEFIITIYAVVEVLDYFVGCHAGIDRRSFYSPCTQVVYLVFHQRDKRGYYYTYPLHSHCGNLECDGFSSSRRHKSESIFSVKHRAYDIFL